MNPFETQLMELAKEAEGIKKQEAEVQTKGRLFNEKLIGFLKENGLPENFTMPELALLAIRQSRK